MISLADPKSLAMSKGAPKAAHTTVKAKTLQNYEDSVKPGLHTSQKDGSKAKKMSK